MDNDGQESGTAGLPLTFPEYLRALDSGETISPGQMRGIEWLKEGAVVANSPLQRDACFKDPIPPNPGKYSGLISVVSKLLAKVNKNL